MPASFFCNILSSCLPCCGLPRTYKRLTDELYRKCAGDRRNPDIQCNTNAIETLVSYCASYPQKLSLVVDCLEERYISSILHEDHGWVILTIETFRALARKFHRLELLHMLEAHLNLVLRCAVQSYRVAYMKAAAKLLKDCIRLDAFSSELDFIDAILDLCETPDSQPRSGSLPADSASSAGHNSLRFMGCTLLTALLKVLYRKPGYLAHRVERIATILLLTIVPTGVVVQPLSESKLLSEIPHFGNFVSKLKSCSPRTIETLGWKAWYELCSAASEEIWILLFEQSCHFFEQRQISLRSLSFYKVLFVLTASKNPFQHCAARTPKFLIDALFSQFMGQKAAVRRVEDFDAWAKKYSAQEEAESLLRHRHFRMAALDDGLQFTTLWIKTEDHRLASLHSPASPGPGLLVSESSVVDWLAALRHCVRLLAMVIKAAPSVVQYDVFKSQWLGRLQHDDTTARMRDLPSALLFFHGVNVFTQQHASEPIELDTLACKVLESIFQTAQSLSLHTSPLGINGLALVETLHEHVHTTRTTYFVGQLETNPLSQYFLMSAFFLMQVWMSNIRVDSCAPLLPSLAPSLPWSLALACLHPLSQPLPVLHCANFEVHRHFFLALATSLLLPPPLSPSPSSPIDPKVVHKLLSFLWRYLQHVSQQALHPAELANYLCLCSDLVHALLHAWGAQACLQALPMFLTMESQWKESCPSRSSAQVAIARFCWQAWFLSFLLSLAKVMQEDSILQWVKQAWPSIGSQQIVVIDPSDSRVRPADKMAAEITAICEGSLEVDRRELLSLFLACPAWQAMQSSVYKAFSVVFDPREDSVAMDHIVVGMDATSHPLPRMAHHILPSKDDRHAARDGEEGKAEDGLSGRDIGEDERGRDREEGDQEASEEDHLLEAVWRDGYSIVQQSAQHLASPSWPYDDEDPTAAIPPHVRTQNWKREYHSQVSFLQESASSMDQLLPEVLSALT